MLEFAHVSIMREKRYLLEDITFTPRPGKITALLGKNGCGKSTLLSCVNRLYPYSGRILLSGRDLSELTPRERAQKIALLPQLLPSTPFTVRRLVELGRTPHTGMDGRLSLTDRQAVTAAMESAKVTPLADRAVSSLSGGEKQRAFLAMLIAQDTPTLLLDEPATFLDADAARTLYGLMTELSHARGKTLLAVMHDLSAAIRVADDIAVLDKGRLLFHGTVGQCLTERVIQDTFCVTACRCEDGTVFFH